NFLHADAMLARDTAAELDALLENVVAGRQRAADLVRIAFIVKHQRMDVAIAGVKNVRNAQVIFFAHRTDELHDLRQLRTRHHAILGKVIRTKPANRAKCPLAAFPEQRAFFVIFRDADFAGPMLFANFNDAPGLPVKPGRQAVQFHNQHRAGIEWKPKVIRRLNRLGDELVHHLQGGGDNTGGDDLTDGRAGIIHALEHAQHGFIGLRRTHEPDQNVRDDTEHSLTADDGPAQIVTVHVFAAVRSRAEPDHFSVGQYDFKAEDVIRRDAVFERVWPARVGRHVASDGAGWLAGRVGGVEQSLGFHGLGYPGVDAAGLHKSASIAGI